jgi:hypothetical protein
MAPRRDVHCAPALALVCYSVRSSTPTSHSTCMQRQPPRRRDEATRVTTTARLRRARVSARRPEPGGTKPRRGKDTGVARRVGGVVAGYVPVKRGVHCTTTTALASGWFGSRSLLRLCVRTARV